MSLLSKDGSSTQTFRGFATGEWEEQTTQSHDASLKRALHDTVLRQEIAAPRRRREVRCHPRGGEPGAALLQVASERRCGGCVRRVTDPACRAGRSGARVRAMRSACALVRKPGGRSLRPGRQQLLAAHQRRHRAERVGEHRLHVGAREARDRVAREHDLVAAFTASKARFWIATFTETPTPTIVRTPRLRSTKSSSVPWNGERPCRRGRTRSESCTSISGTISRGVASPAAASVGAFAMYWKMRAFVFAPLAVGAPLRRAVEDRDAAPRAPRAPARPSGAAPAARRPRAREAARGRPSRRAGIPG